MPSNRSDHIAHHTLRIRDPQSCLSFYQQKLGMKLLAQHAQDQDHGTEQHYFLGFANSETDSSFKDDLVGRSDTLLELFHQPDQEISKERTTLEGKEGYWKIGITLADVDLARQSLIEAGIQVSAARQFRDIGYMCHLDDPEGNSIELLQHHFAQNHQPQLPQMDYPLRGLPTLGQITLRVKDPEASLQFYIEGLGMRLLSRQLVEPYRFTLYFLAFTNEEPPHRDIDDVNNREWLWQRPYTTLELQHVWGTEQGEFAYRVNTDTGFYRMSFALQQMDGVVKKLGNAGVEVKTASDLDTLLQAKTATVLDPDGYSVRLIATT